MQHCQSCLAVEKHYNQHTIRLIVYCMTRTYMLQSLQIQYVACHMCRIKESQLLQTCTMCLCIMYLDNINPVPAPWQLTPSICSKLKSRWRMVSRDYIGKKQDQLVLSAILLLACLLSTSFFSFFGFTSAALAAGDDCLERCVCGVFLCVSHCGREKGGSGVNYYCTIVLSVLPSSGFFLHRAKRGNLPPPPFKLPMLHVHVYMYTIKQPTSMIVWSIPTTLRACSWHIHLWGLGCAYWSIFPLFEKFIEKTWSSYLFLFLWLWFRHRD